MPLPEHCHPDDRKDLYVQPDLTILPMTLPEHCHPDDRKDLYVQPDLTILPMTLPEHCHPDDRKDLYVQPDLTILPMPLPEAKKSCPIILSDSLMEFLILLRYIWSCYFKVNIKSYDSVKPY